MKWPVITFLLAAIFGVLLGSRKEQHEAEKISKVSSIVASRSITRSAPQMTSNEMHERALKLASRNLSLGPNPFANLLTNWSDAEIQAALEGAVNDPAIILGQDGAGVVGSLLFGEWLERDIDAAVAWFDGIEIEMAQERMALGISFRWPVDEAERGLSFVADHKDLFPGGQAWSILVKNLEQSAKAGPEKLSEMIVQADKLEMTFDFGNKVSFPPGFDFSSFAETEGFSRLKEDELKKSIVATWMEQDREGAFNWLIENEQPDNVVATVLNDRWPKQDKVPLDWLGDKLDEMDPSEWRAIIVGGHQVLKNDPVSARALAVKIENQEFREQIHEIGASCISKGMVTLAIQHLEGIEDPTRRPEILQSVIEPYGSGRYNSRQPVSNQDVQTLKEKLIQWQASEAQIDEILSKLKP